MKPEETAFTHVNYGAVRRGKECQGTSLVINIHWPYGVLP